MDLGDFQKSSIKPSIEMQKILARKFSEDRNAENRKQFVKRREKYNRQFTTTKQITKLKIHDENQFLSFSRA